MLVVDEVAPGAVGAVALEVVRFAQFGLVARVAVNSSQFYGAVRELALAAVAALTSLFERAAQFRFVAIRTRHHAGSRVILAARLGAGFQLHRGDAARSVACFRAASHVALHPLRLRLPALLGRSRSPEALLSVACLLLPWLTALARMLHSVAFIALFLTFFVR